MSTQPIEQRWRPNLVGVVPQEAEHAIRLIFDGIQDHDDAIVALKGQVDALKTSTVTNNNTTTINNTTSGGSTPSVPTIPYLGVVNNQTGVTAYTTQTTDNGALVVLNNASPVAVSLNSVVSAPYLVAITNEGAGTLTLTPTSGVITAPGNIGVASITVASGYSAWVYFDGTNWWAITFPTGGGATFPTGTGFVHVTGGVPDSPAVGLPSTIGYTIDGGGSTPTTGVKGFVKCPYAGTITKWTIVMDASGSCQFDIQKCTYAAFPTTSSIVASAPPAVSSAQKAQSATLTGWTTAVNVDDIFEFVLSSVSGSCTRIQIFMDLTRT